MRTRIIILGIVVLVIGIALIAVGAIGALRSVTIINQFSQTQGGGEYVSSKIILNSTSSILVITSPVAQGGLIPSQDLSLVNSTNYASYVISSNSTAAGAETYRGLSGSYYYVSFSSSQPTSSIVVTGGLASSIALFGLLSLAGIALIVIGIIIAIIGAVLKKKPPAPEREISGMPSPPPSPGV